MTRVVVLNHQLVREHIASVHKEGCRDIERDKRNHWSVEMGPYDSLKEALDNYIDAEMQEMGWSLSDVKIYPCAKE